MRIHRGQFIHRGEIAVDTQRLTIELEIDLDAVMRVLGTQAFRNKSKRSHDLGGLVKATVIKSW